MTQIREVTLAILKSKVSLKILVTPILPSGMLIGSCNYWISTVIPRLLGMNSTKPFSERINMILINIEENKFTNK